MVTGKTPTLTLVTMVLNGGAAFARTLDSVAAQTCKDFAYVVLDGQSTDGTLDLVERYRTHVSLCHSRKDKGALDAFNRALPELTGDYVGFLSADDWLEPDAVERIVAEAQAHPEAGIIGFGMKFWRQRSDGELTPESTLQDPDDGVFDVPNALYGGCINRVFRRDLFARHGTFDHATYGWFADREMQLRFALENPRKIVIPQVLYHFRNHDGSTTGNGGVATTVASMQGNLRVADVYLRGKPLTVRQRHQIQDWYGFSWFRCVWFRVRAKRFAEALTSVIQGLRTHPMACLRALISPNMPDAYRPRKSE